MKGVGGRRIPSGAPLSGRKLDRDEDLLLFKELHKRDKDRLASLLQPVSDEFEPHSGNHTLYRITSGKKGPGYELYGGNEKHDYDWLKTPPATPLFPSLEMETNAPETLVHKELPILQPLSRFAGNSSASKGITGRPKSPNPMPVTNSKIPLTSLTPNQRSPSIPSLETKNANTIIPTLNRKMAILSTDSSSDKRATTKTSKPAAITTNQPNFLTSNLNKTTSQEVKRNPRSRGVSPSVRSPIPAEIPAGFSNETPSNLRTTANRASSATRGRPAAPTTQPAHTTKTERAKSATRGRRENIEAMNGGGEFKGSKVQTGNGFHQPQVFGSRMVDKVMNARKLQGAMEKETKSRPQVSNGAANGSSVTGLGKLMPKSSLDLAYKQLEMKRDRTNSHRLGSVHGRSSNWDQYR